MNRHRASTVGGLLCAALLAGCAAGASVERARASLAAAKAAGAEGRAPYEYYMAEAFLKNAEHEVEEGDGKTAASFASESEKYAAQAAEKARGGAK